MKTKYIAITLALLLVYYGAAYYIGWHLYEAIRFVIPSYGGLLYWIMYITLSAAYLLGRIGQVFYPSSLSNCLIRIGAYWTGFLFYLLLGWMLADLAGFAAAWLQGAAYQYSLPPFVNGSVIAAAAAICIAGIIQARQPQICTYELSIQKQCSLSELHIVAASDIHLGLMVGKNRLDDFVNQVNALKPDVVLLAGDILDENVGTFLDEQMHVELQKIIAPMGIFACLGSHEYIWGDPQRALKALALAGVTVLKDDVMMIAGGIYLAGRDDAYKGNLTGRQRKSLQELLQGCDRTRPIILLDHYPAHFEEAKACGVDLQLSGHTHQGQMFPLNWITRQKFELDAGYRHGGYYHVIVSSGFGTWLMPIRVGTTPEILSIRLKFKPLQEGENV